MRTWVWIIHSYGYRNVWEVAPLLDPATSRLVLVASPPRRESKAAAGGAPRPER